MSNKVCKNCGSKKKSNPSSSKSISFQSPDKYIHTEYGMAKILTPQQMTYHYNDDYMIARFQRAQKKVNKLQKQLKQVKRRLQKCQYGMHNALNRDNGRRDSSVNSVRLYESKISKASSIGTDGSVQKNGSQTSSRKREIGRFTKISDQQLPAPYAEYSELKKGAEMRRAPELERSNDNEDYGDEFGQYLPNDGMNRSSYFNQNEQEKQERLNRRFEDLILSQKSAREEDRKQIRKQIAAISRMLVNDQYY